MGKKEATNDSNPLEVAGDKAEAMEAGQKSNDDGRPKQKTTHKKNDDDVWQEKSALQGDSSSLSKLEDAKGQYRLAENSSSLMNLEDAKAQYLAEREQQADNKTKNDDKDKKDANNDDEEEDMPSPSRTPLATRQDRSVSQPGAFRVNASRREPNHESSHDDSSWVDDDDLDAETGAMSSSHQNTNNNEDEEGQNLIQAELVEETDKVFTEGEVVNLDAEQRKRLFLFIMVAIILVAIAVGITVPVVNNNNSNTPNTATGDSPNVTPNDNNPPTTAAPSVSAPPSLSTMPSPAGPSPRPSTSQEPTQYPTAAPTRLVWDEAIVPNEQQLNGIGSEFFGYEPLGGGRAGTKVHLRDVRNSSLGENFNRPTMVIVNLGGDQEYLQPTQDGPVRVKEFMSNYLYFCGYTTEEIMSMGDNTANSDPPREYCEFAFSIGLFHGLSASSPGGNFFVEESNGGELHVYDFANFGSAILPRPQMESALPVALAVNQAGDMIHRVSTREVCRFGVTIGVFSAEITSQECVLATSLPTLDEEGVPVPDPSSMEEELHAFDASQDAIVILRLTVTPGGTCLACSLYAEYRVHTLSTSGSMMEIAPPLVSTGMEIDDAVVALSGNGTVMAISIIAFRTARQNIVSVYRMEDSTWQAMGLPLVGEVDGGDNFGFSLSFNEEGNMLAIGAPSDDSNGINSGRVYIYKWIDGEWALSGDIQGSAGSSLGYSVDLHASERQILVGAPSSRVNGADSGYAHLYNLLAASA